MFGLIFLALAVVGAVVAFARSSDRTTGSFLRLFFVALVICVVGLDSLWAATGHLFIPDEIAREIGWAPGSPFQFEVGVANLAVGVGGLLAIVWRGRYLMGPVVIWAVFLLGAAWGHFVQLARGDTAPYNAGFFLYFSDIAMPLLVLALAVFYYRTAIAGRETNNPAATSRAAPASR